MPGVLARRGIPLDDPPMLAALCAITRIQDITQVRYVVTVRQQPAGVRESVERLSLKPAAYLQQLPRWLPPVAFAALFIAGLAVPGWVGAALLLVVAAFVAWLGLLSWPALSAPARLLRLAVPAALVALAVWQGLR